MRIRRTRVRHKDPSEKQKPFFDKQTTEETKFFSANSVQRKLTVGKANDAAEKEAELVAKKVMQVQKAEKKEEEKPVQKAEKKEEEKPVQKAEEKEEEKSVQKAEKKEEEKPLQKAEKKEEEKPVQKAEEKEEEKPVQKEEKKEEEKPLQKAEKKEEEKPVQKAESKKAGKLIQRVSASVENKDDESTQPSFEKLLAKRKGMGFAMPNDLRRNMEEKFHTNFRDVRIHIDKEAADMCETIHAQAFTHGYDIYFNEGMYNPDALYGRELLAHELAHVVQQNG